MTVKPHTHSPKKKILTFLCLSCLAFFFLFLLSPLLYSEGGGFSFTGGGRRGHFSFGLFFFFLRVCGKSERVLFFSSRTVNTLLGTASLLLLLLHFRCGVFGHPIPSSSSAHTNLFLTPPKKPCRGHLSVGMSPYSVCSALGLPHEKAGLD